MASTSGPVRWRSSCIGPGASGTSIARVPTRWTVSASRSPPNRQRCSPPSHRRVARASAPSIGVRRSLTTWTSSASASPGDQLGGRLVGDDDHGPAGVDQRLVAGLRLALVVEHRPADRRLGVGQRSWAKPAGRPVLEPAQRLDLPADHRRLVRLAWPRRHASKVGWSAGGTWRSNARALEAVARPELVPVEVRPASGATKSAVSGTAPAPNSDTNRTTRGRSRAKAGRSRSSPCAPPEVEVGVGAVELGRVGQHAASGRPRAGCRRCAGLRLIEPVEHRVVPRRQLLARAGPAHRRPATGPTSPGRRRRGTARRAPHHTATDGWWPSRSTASRAWRMACLRMLRA